MAKKAKKAKVLDMTKFLALLTGKKGWKSIDGPESHVGVDHWFKTGKKEAKININEVNGRDMVSVEVTDLASMLYDAGWGGTYVEACEYKGE